MKINDTGLPEPEVFKHWGNGEAEEDYNRRSIILAEIGTDCFERVLDIGCGSGFITRKLPGREIIGIDKDLELNQCDHNSLTTFKELSLAEFAKTQKAGTFDLITAIDVLYPFYFKEQLQLARVLIDKLLKPDGKLVIVQAQSLLKFTPPYLREKEIIFEYREIEFSIRVFIK